MSGRRRVADGIPAEARRLRHRAADHLLRRCQPVQLVIAEIAPARAAAGIGDAGDVAREVEAVIEVEVEDRHRAGGNQGEYLFHGNAARK
ncbi:MAG: hypothetical protein JSU82_15520 [Rhodospirillales bacterium]|nr:MAG: hypothetical protein JSU82_15520 [Rhodospirillales bacterium]